MTPKYKIGDKVKVISSRSLVNAGDVGIIVGIDKSLDAYDVKFKTRTYFVQYNNCKKVN